MAAEIIEAQSEEPNTDQLPTDEAAMSPEELVQEFEGEPSFAADGQTTEEPPFEDDVPEKYRGKSLKDVVTMHQEAEKALGRQGSEVGELRKVVDQYIQTQISQQPTPEPVKEEVDFFEDPEKAVSQAIDSHPDILAARDATQRMQRQTALTQLQQKHPDAQAVLQDPAFAQWVQQSPMRMQMYHMADQQYNFDAADELISNYKERQTVAQQTHQVETKARQQQLKAAATGSSSGANTSGSKRIYRRTDIIKLMKTDPDRYEALSPEIMQAYAEGRVR